MAFTVREFAVFCSIIRRLVLGLFLLLGSRAFLLLFVLLAFLARRLLALLLRGGDGGRTGVRVGRIRGGSRVLVLALLLLLVLFN